MDAGSLFFLEKDCIMENVFAHVGGASEEAIRKTKMAGPVITISRECGCSAKRIAAKLAKILSGYCYVSETKTSVEWRWVSKEIIEQAASELSVHPDKIETVFLNEIKPEMSEVASAFSSDNAYKATDKKIIDTVRQVIHRIAEEGHYIIVGRAATVIAGDIPANIRIRLQAPLEWRINRIQQMSNMSYMEAKVYVLETDQQRDLFAEHIAGRKLDNSDYDLIFNYSTLLDDHIVDAIVTVLKNKKLIIPSEEDY